MGLIAEEKMKLLERRFWRENQVCCGGGASLDKAETASHMDRGTVGVWRAVELNERAASNVRAVHGRGGEEQWSKCLLRGKIMKPRSPLSPYVVRRS